MVHHQPVLYFLADLFCIQSGEREVIWAMPERKHFFAGAVPLLGICVFVFACRPALLTIRTGVNLACIPNPPTLGKVQVMQEPDDWSQPCYL